MNLVIIPARGGSTRLKQKNIRTVHTQPLIYYTMDAVAKSFSIDDTIIFTTDSNVIQDIAQDHQHANKFKFDLRPNNLATNESKVIDTIIYYFNQYQCDQIWYFLPTCPLRRSVDISKCRKLLTEDYDGILSITDYEFPPTLGMVLEDGIIRDWHVSQPWRHGNTRSQDQQIVHRPNGAIYGMWAHKFQEHKSFYKGNMLGYHMDRSHSIDIDTYEDLLMAKILLQEKDNKNDQII